MRQTSAVWAQDKLGKMNSRCRNCSFDRHVLKVVKQTPEKAASILMVDKRVGSCGTIGEVSATLLTTGTTSPFNDKTHTMTPVGQDPQGAACFSYHMVIEALHAARSFMQSECRTGKQKAFSSLGSCLQFDIRARATQHRSRKASTSSETSGWLWDNVHSLILSLTGN